MRASLEPLQLAEALGASEKSVRRWIDGVTVPHPRMRYRVALAVGEDESYLWPQATDRTNLSGAELVSSWPRRSEVPKHLWVDLLRDCTRNFDLLAFAGLFLPEEHSEWIPLLHQKASSGVRVRLLIGDPTGRHLSSRDAEHRIGGGVRGRVDAVIAQYAPLSDVIEIRGHDTPLYNSIYRFDDQMLVNSHVYGLLAAYTPVLRFRRIDGQYFDTYMESFERVWAGAPPLDLGSAQVTSSRG